MPAYAHKFQSLDVGPLSSNAKHESKDILLTILNKLGDRDTQQKAQTELGSLVRVRCFHQLTSQQVWSELFRPQGNAA